MVLNELNASRRNIYTSDFADECLAINDLCFDIFPAIKSVFTNDFYVNGSTNADSSANVTFQIKYHEGNDTPSPLICDLPD